MTVYYRDLDIHQCQLTGSQSVWYPVPTDTYITDVNYDIQPIDHTCIINMFEKGKV